jgi:hypothetical protein
MSLTKLSVGGKNDVKYKIFLPRESLVSDNPAGDGNIEKLFFSVVTNIFCIFPRSSSLQDFLRSCHPDAQCPCGRMSGTDAFFVFPHFPLFSEGKGLCRESEPEPLLVYDFFNPILYIRDFSCPSSVQTSLTQNCSQLTILAPNSQYCQLYAVTPNPESLTNSKTMRQTTITICRGLSHPTCWAALPSENISRRFYKGRETLWWYK